MWMGTCIQTHENTQLVSVVAGLMPKIVKHEKLNVLAAKPNNKLLENEFIIFIMCLIRMNGPMWLFFCFQSENP